MNSRGRRVIFFLFIRRMKMLEKLIKNTKELNVVAEKLKENGETNRLREICEKWLIPEKDVEDFLTGKRVRLAEIPLEEKHFDSASEKITEEMYHLSGPGIAIALGKYLLEHLEAAGLEKQILLKHKSLEKCINYILEKVYEESKDYLKQNHNGRQAMGVAISDTKVYQWMQEYYFLDDEAEEKKKKEEQQKKEREERERKKKASENIKSLKNNSTHQMPAASKKKNAETGNRQLSLFDMLSGKSDEQEKVEQLNEQKKVGTQNTQETDSKDDMGNTKEEGAEV